MTRRVDEVMQLRLLTKDSVISNPQLSIKTITSRFRTFIETLDSASEEEWCVRIFNTPDSSLRRNVVAFLSLQRTEFGLSAEVNRPLSVRGVQGTQLILIRG